jgi:putative PIN family toxin of toxin-antitoxin system
VSGSSGVVLDTNVIVSGLLTSNPDAPTAELLDAVIDGDLRVFLSDPLFDEYRAVLLRPNIRSLHGLDPEEVDRLLQEIALEAMFREPVADGPAAPDPGDQHLYNLLAATTDATLVTGDQRLLDAPPPHHQAVTPRTYLDTARGT